MAQETPPDRFDALSRAANTQNDGHAMAAVWDAAFGLDRWVLVGRAMPQAGGGTVFAPLTAEIDGATFAAAFTDRARAEGFLSEQPERAGVIELPVLEAIEWLADLLLAGAAEGVIFNDGRAPFLARIADLPDLLRAHAPGFGI